MGIDSDELHRLYERAYENKSRLNAKYLKQFVNPFWIKIFDRETIGNRTQYRERKIFFIGEGADYHYLTALKELFPDSQYKEEQINVTHLNKFPEFKIVVYFIVGDSSTIHFFNKTK